MPEPLIFSTNPGQSPEIIRSVAGKSLVIHEWSGSGPEYLHVHYEDDEAWYVLEGEINFRFTGKTITAKKGDLVFVPAGTPHTYTADQSTRYLIILTPALHELIEELHKHPLSAHAEIMKRFRSEIL